MGKKLRNKELSQPGEHIERVVPAHPVHPSARRDLRRQLENARRANQEKDEIIEQQRIEIGRLQNYEKFWAGAADIIAEAGMLKDEYRRDYEKLCASERKIREAQRSKYFLCFIRAMNKAAHARDADTFEHERRVALSTRLLCKKLGLEQWKVEDYSTSALLHDVGKLAVPDKILLKPGLLTETERGEMKIHTVIGDEILAEVASIFGTSPQQVARSHHEGWNGKGYPDGLSGEDIPEAARIVHVVDVFDAVAYKRLYTKEQRTLSKVLAIMKSMRDADYEKGSFEPRLHDAFVELVQSGQLFEEYMKAGFSFPPLIPEGQQTDHSPG